MNVTFTNNKNQKFTFVHIPKTAGKSISAYIFKYAKETTTLHEKSHATISELKSLGKELGHTFAIGRNPYSRAVSLYRYLYEANIKKLVKEADPYFGAKSNLDWYHNWLEKNGKKCSFLQFCNKLPYVPLGEFQHPYVDVDSLFKFEEMNVVNDFLKNIFSSDEDLFHLNKTGDDNYKKYYNDKTVEIVYQQYEKDFKSLGYSIDINSSI